MTDDFAAIEAAAAKLPPVGLADMLRAQREAEQAPPPPPSVIPQPDYPYPLRHALGGIVRYRCPLDCGWSHDENPGAEPNGPLLLPIGFTNEQLGDAITSMAQIQSNAFARRVEQAITDHCAEAHPER